MYIYGLVCPLKNKIRYVGQTKNLKIRLQGHKDEFKRNLRVGKLNTHKDFWLNQLYEKGLLGKLSIILIEVVNTSNVNEKEIYWINEYNSIGKLTNSTKGGDGVSAMTEEIKRKISIANKGEKNGMYGVKFKMEETHKKSISEGLKNSEKLKESRKSNEYREKISDAVSIPVLVLDEKYNVIYRFKNSTECSKFFNYSRGNIKNAIRYNRQIGKGKNYKYWVIREENLETFIQSKTIWMNKL